MIIKNIPVSNFILKAFRIDDLVQECDIYIW